MTPSISEATAMNASNLATVFAPVSTQVLVLANRYCVRIGFMFCAEDGFVVGRCGIVASQNLLRMGKAQEAEVMNTIEGGMQLLRDAGESIKFVSQLIANPPPAMDSAAI
eukprot:COSAG05_NODE_126_length_17260_cov_8.550434_10_plen_110_part_00